MLHQAQNLPTVLFFEGERHLQEFFIAAFYYAEFHLEVASNGEEGMKKFQEHHPKLVLLSGNVQGSLTSSEICHHLHTQSDIPVILLAKDIDEQISKLIEREEITACFTLPLDVDELVRYILSLLPQQTLNKPMYPKSVDISVE